MSTRRRPFAPSPGALHGLPESIVSVDRTDSDAMDDGNVQVPRPEIFPFKDGAPAIAVCRLLIGFGRIKVGDDGALIPGDATIGHEIHAPNLVPLLWLALFDIDDLHVVDVTARLASKDCSDPVFATYLRTSLASARVRLRNAEVYAASRSYWKEAWRSIVLLRQLLDDPSLGARSVVAVDLGALGRAVEHVHFIRTLQELLAWAREIRTGSDAEMPAVLEAWCSGDVRHDGDALRHCYDTESTILAFLKQALGWPASREISELWEQWVIEMSPRPKATAKDRIPGASAFLALLVELGYVELEFESPALLAAVADVLEQPLLVRPSALENMLFHHPDVAEVFGSTEELGRAVVDWG